MANNNPEEMHEVCVCVCGLLSLPLIRDTMICGEQAFKAFNRSGGGFLNEADLRSVLEKMGESVTDEELTVLIKEMDIDGDGKISFDEFQRMLLS